MKLCQGCGQLLAEDITTCPVCGNEVAEGRKAIDDYRIIDVLHEGYATILCRAVKDQAEESVMIRIFSPNPVLTKKSLNALKMSWKNLRNFPKIILSGILKFGSHPTACGTGSANGWIRKTGEI